MKQVRTPDMVEGTEAWTRFTEAAKKLVFTPKGSAQNPFGKRKKKTPARKS